MSKPYQDEELLREMYIDKGMSKKEIAEKIGYGDALTVSKYFKKYNIKEDKLYTDEKLLREMYIDKDMSESEIADELDCVRQTVSKYLKKYDLKNDNTRLPSIADTEKFVNFMYLKRGVPVADIYDFEELLRKKYYKEMCSQRGIANMIGVSHHSVRSWCRYFNFEIRGQWVNCEADSESRKTSKYKKWRKSVYKRDDYTCQDCGDTNCMVHAHHIVPWSESEELRFDVDNGVTLCKQCHADRHEARGDDYHELIRNS